jgi:hypothetical protein
MGYVEELPKQCPNGHVFRGHGTVLVGWLPCDCVPNPDGGRGHRTVLCLACESTWYNPPHDGREWIAEADRDTPGISARTNIEDVLKDR